MHPEIPLRTAWNLYTFMSNELWPGRTPLCRALSIGILSREPGAGTTAVRVMGAASARILHCCRPDERKKDICTLQLQIQIHAVKNKALLRRRFLRTPEAQDPNRALALCLL